MIEVLGVGKEAVIVEKNSFNDIMKSVDVVYHDSKYNEKWDIYKMTDKVIILINKDAQLCLLIKNSIFSRKYVRMVICPYVLKNNNLVAIENNIINISKVLRNDNDCVKSLKTFLDDLIIIYDNDRICVSYNNSIMSIYKKYTYNSDSYINSPNGDELTITTDNAISTVSFDKDENIILNQQITISTVY